jgi:hypothetical protein
MKKQLGFFLICALSINVLLAMLDASPSKLGRNIPIVEQGISSIKKVITKVKSLSQKEAVMPCATPLIVGSSIGCKNGRVSVSVDTFTTGHTYNWSITGPASVIGTNVGSATVVLPDLDSGTYVLTLTETSLDQCVATTTKQISIERNVALVCDNEVNISVGDNCRNEVTASILLEGNVQSDDAYTITIKNQAGTTVTMNGSAQNFISQPLIFTVTSKCTGNSCWGNLVFEDKIAPTINCPTTVDTIVCNNVNAAIVTPTAMDNCGGTTQVTIISNNVVEQPCSAAPVAAIRTIVYGSKDSRNNIATNCSKKIVYKSFEVDSIKFPRNLDGSPGALPYYTCDNLSWDLNRNYYPDPAESGWPKINGVNLSTTNGYCKINMTYTDDTIKICANSFKILRHWTILDWCSGDIVTHAQVIKVLDDKGPVVTCSPDFTPNIQLKPYECTADVRMVKPVVIFDCSKWDYKVQYLLADANGLPPIDGKYIETNVVRNADSTYTIRNLPKGLTWIKYIITDECGNTENCFSEVYVRDNTAPVAICQDYTVASVVNTGVAQIPAASFDDGSHDNCGVVAFQVARVEAGCGFNTTFGPTARFCCDEIGKEQMVALRVWDDANCNGIFGDVIDVYNDANGDGILGNGSDRLIGRISDNSNTCMVRVKIQDKAPPVITCPVNITIDCQAQSDTSFTGVARAVDNCSGVRVSMTELRNINQCWVGTITRTFTATDVSGNTSTCRQIVTLEDRTPFLETNITWPRPLTELTTCNTPTDIDPSKLGRPTWVNNECSLVASEYKDQVFNIVDSVCIKILRTWTVIDWCTFNPDRPTAGGRYTFIQVIKFNNKEKPKFLGTCTDTTICVEALTCEGSVTLTTLATDDCTKPADMTYIYTIDRKDDGTVENFGGGVAFTRNLIPDVYRVKVTARDGCGNEEICSRKLTVKDCKRPTPYCYSDLTTVVMNDPNKKEVAIWARDFDLGSSDNCGGPLRFSFSDTNPRDTGKIFTCSTRGLQRLKVWVYDTTGNKEFCEVRIDIQANNGICGAGSTINGRVAYSDDKPLKNVAVNYTENNSLENKISSSDSEGKFSFFTASNPSTVTIYPEYDLDINKGISTLDLVYIQRHILGIAKLDSPYKLISADVNKSGNITASDLVSLRKVILGSANSFPNQKSYVFVDKNAVFANPENPFDFSGKISAAPNSIFEFMAVKIGDVNNSASTGQARLVAEPRNANTLILEKTINANGEYLIVVKSGFDINISGLQTAIDFKGNLENVELIPAELEITSDNVNQELLNRGIISVSYAANGTKSVSKNDVLFTIKGASKDIELNKAKLVNDVLASEIYDESLNTNGLKLEVRTDGKANGFSVSQNAPNPFTQSTSIEIEMPSDADVRWYVTDITGRKLMEKSSFFTVGSHTITIKAEELKTSGVMTYTIETPFGTISKKMIFTN